MANNKNRNKRQRQKMKQQRQIYGGMALVALVIIAGIAYMVLNAPPEVSAERLELEPIQGNGTVMVVEYGAYGCHACREVHQNGRLQNILQQYNAQILFTFRNAPIIHANDPLSAEAAQCALDQGTTAFWDFHNALYSISDSEYNDHTAAEDYARLATEAGLNGDALQTCLDENTHQRTVDHWHEISQDDQVRGTPTFFVNGRRLANVGQLESAIIQALES